MTTPTTPQADRITAQEIRELFEGVHIEISELRADLTQIREGLAHASQPAPAVGKGKTETVKMVKMIKTRANGKDYFKMQGGQYMKRGVTVWDEVLQAMDLHPDGILWEADDSIKLEPPLNVLVLLKEYTDETTGEVKTTPQKVIGKA